MTKYTTYRIATKWLNNDYVLANNITDFDESIWENNRFNDFNEYDDPIEIYQYFITDASRDDVEFLEKNFGLKFSYSSKLDCFVLCVDHWGTNWDCVSCEISEELLKINPELEYTDSCYPPMIKTSREFIAGGKR